MPLSFFSSVGLAQDRLVRALPRDRQPLLPIEVPLSPGSQPFLGGFETPVSPCRVDQQDTQPRLQSPRFAAEIQCRARPKRQPKQTQNGPPRRPTRPPARQACRARRLGRFYFIGRAFTLGLHWRGQASRSRQGKPDTPRRN